MEILIFGFLFSLRRATRLRVFLLLHYQKDKSVDLAFLTLASFHFSPDYPCTLLRAINPTEIVWIHWEDFFRKYSKDPKTLRGTDIVKFFELPCVKPYKAKALLPWPGVGFDFK